MLATLLDSRQAFHRVVLIKKVATWDPKTLARVGTLTGTMIAKGFDPAAAHQKALALLDGGVSMQAAVMSFGDTFWATGALIILTLPLVLLLGKGGGKVDGALTPGEGARPRANGVGSSRWGW